ncbi:MAG: hypothetical protein N3A69_14565, partial [Leptospiraceae bacterium]|nr:hypothetical protein [Leptospiraceae bacterium]
MENSEDKIENGFEIPFHLNEILPNPNQHKIHRKPLMNAENMIKKGKYKSALEIYVRTVSKFPEPEIRAKLNQIIQELENYLQKADQSYTRKSRASTQEKQELDLQEKDFSNALKELSDDLT